MKILQMNVVYGEGSTGKIVQALHNGFISNGIESLVLYGREPVVTEQHVRKVGGEIYGKFQALLSRVSGVMYGGCRLSTGRIIKTIRQEKADVVLLHCINGHFVNIFKLIEYLKQQSLNTILVLHAEFMYTGSCGHSFECDKWLSGCGKCPQLKTATKSWFFDRTAHSWILMRNAFLGMKRISVVSVSPWLMERAKSSPILCDKYHEVVLNGVDTATFRIQDSATLKQKLGLKGRKVVFQATASFSDDPHDIKGGHFLLAVADILRNEPITFVVAKNSGPPMQLPSNIIDVGKITDQSILAQYYSMADVTLLTSKTETFSMVCAESLCCGTPVVGFKAGAPEMISLKEFSQFVDHGDTDSLVSALRVWLSKDTDKTEVSGVAKKMYAMKEMVNGYLEVANRLLASVTE